MDLMIETINDLDFGWKADVCKLQKHHEQYGSHCDDQMNLMIDVEQSSESESETKAFGTGEGFDQALSEAQKYQKKYASSKEIPETEIP